MLPVSAAFLAAQAASVNKPKAKAKMVFGNYALRQTASSSGAFSADYPAAGAVDGDKSEINMGAAASADNGAGGSTWRSSGIPDNGDSVWWSVNWGTLKYINRVKIYQQSGHGLSEYYVDFLTDDGWLEVAHRVAGGTGIPSGPYPDGYGVEEYGVEPYGSPWPSYEYEWPLTLAQIDVPKDVSCYGIRIRPVHTEVAGDYANLVEVQVFRAVDVTTRLISVDTYREKDFRLENTLAASCNLEVDNTDKFFSLGYTPTDDEKADGYTNADLKAGMGLEVSLGYDLGGVVEYAPQFTGYINSIRGNTIARRATIEARDAMQFLMARKDFSRFKTDITHDEAVRYVLNRYGFSDYEMDIQATSRPLAFFFTKGETGNDVIRLLVESCTDGDFYFDEYGKAVFKNFATRNSFALNIYEYWAATGGTNMSVENPRGAIRRNHLYDDFGAAKLLPNLWNPVPDTLDSTIFPSWDVALKTGSAIDYAANVTLKDTTASINIASMLAQANSNPSYNPNLPATWSKFWIDLWIEGYVAPTGGYVGGDYIAMVVSFGGLTNTSHGGNHVGNYYFEIVTNGSGTRYRVKKAGAAGYLIDVAGSMPTTSTRFELKREDTGGNIPWTLYVNGVSVGTGTETTAAKPISGIFMVQAMKDIVNDAGFTATYWCNNIIFGYEVGATNPATYTSQPIDMGAAATGLDRILMDYYAAANNSMVVTLILMDDALYTNANSYVVTPNSDISALAFQRFAVISVATSGSSDWEDVQFPIINNITLAWFETNPKYSASADVDLQGQKLEIQQEVTDTMGGDNIVYNSIEVTANALVLEGENPHYDSAVGMVGGDVVHIFKTNEAEISNANPLTISARTEFTATLNEPLDGRMMEAGTINIDVLADAGINYGWIQKNPARPVFYVEPTGASANIVRLQLWGKTYGESTKYRATAEDTASIQQYDVRELPVENRFIQSAEHAAAVADRKIDLFKEARVYIPLLKTRPFFAIRLGDRAHLYDAHAGVDGDYLVQSVQHHYDLTEIYSMIMPVRIA